MAIIKKDLIDSYIFMDSPVPLMVVFSIYILFVLGIGPRFMKNRLPMELKTFIRAYNVLQVIACAVFVKLFLDWDISLMKTWQCVHSKSNLDANQSAFVGFCFIMLRISELSETVVFVLRKKQNQVSTLHVYHHISTIILLWLFIKYNQSEFKVRHRSKKHKIT